MWKGFCNQMITVNFLAVIFLKYKKDLDFKIHSVAASASGMRASGVRMIT